MQLCNIPKSYKAADTKFHNNKIIWNNYIFILHILTSIKELTLVIVPMNADTTLILRRNLMLGLFLIAY